LALNPMAVALVKLPAVTSADLPIAVLLMPVVLATSEFSPPAVLAEPVVLILRWTPFVGQHWGNFKRESRRSCVGYRRSSWEPPPLCWVDCTDPPLNLFSGRYDGLFAGRRDHSFDERHEQPKIVGQCLEYDGARSVAPVHRI